jgi:hypothetical protein
MSLVCASFTTFSFSFRFFWHGSFSLFFASYGCHELLEKGHHIGRRLLKSPVPVVLLCTSPPPPTPPLDAAGCCTGGYPPCSVSCPCSRCCHPRMSTLLFRGGARCCPRSSYPALMSSCLFWPPKPRPEYHTTSLLHRLHGNCSYHTTSMVVGTLPEQMLRPVMPHRKHLLHSHENHYHTTMAVGLTISFHPTA